MSMTVYCLDIAFYSHISTDRKYDNMIMVIMQGYRCKGKVKRLVSSQWVFLLMGVVHWLDQSAPKIAKWDTCRGACVVYNAVGLWHCFKPCWCCLIAVLDVLFENYCWNSAVLFWSCFTFSMAVPTIVSSGLPVTLPGCACWWWSPTLHHSACWSQDKKDRRLRTRRFFLSSLQQVEGWSVGNKKDRGLCPCQLAVYNGCVSESWWCHDLHLSRDQNLVACCIYIYIMYLYVEPV